MSSDTLLRDIELTLGSIPTPRPATRLYAAIAVLEGAGSSDQDLEPAVVEYVRALHGFQGRPQPRYASHPRTTLTGRGHYVVWTYAEERAERDAATSALRDFDELARSAAWHLHRLPPPVRHRLGFSTEQHALSADWLYALFHLMWHYPNHFLDGQAAARDRFVQVPKPSIRPAILPEFWLQTASCVSVEDRFPGVVYSAIPQGTDLVSATCCALKLLQEAVRANRNPEPDRAKIDFSPVEQDFRQFGQTIANTPDYQDNVRRALGWATAPAGALDFTLIRLGSSFIYPPASEWANYHPPRPERDLDLFLSRRSPSAEVAVLRGGFVNQFRDLADRAGGLLPNWPRTPYPPLVHDADLFRLYSERRTAGDPLPVVTIPSDYSGIVTDHRGNVERWIGFVVHTLKTLDPEAVMIRPAETGVGCPRGDEREILTLKMNLFTASARAIELVSAARQAIPVAAAAPTPPAPPPPPPDGPVEDGGGIGIRWKGTYYPCHSSERRAWSAIREMWPPQRGRGLSVEEIKKRIGSNAKTKVATNLSSQMNAILGRAKIGFTVRRVRGPDDKEDILWQQVCG